MKNLIDEEKVRLSPVPPDKNNNTQMGEALWTVEEVAEYLKLQPETIRSMARRGELPAIKLGKVWRFQKTAIHEKISTNTDFSSAGR